MRLEFIITAALLLDIILGDPRWLPHPVRGIAAIATVCERFFRKACFFSLRIAGILTALTIIGLCSTAAILILKATSELHWTVAAAAGIFILYVSIAPRDLINHAHAVYKALILDSLDNARLKVAMIVGRDTANLDKKGITRAAVETVAESLVDGVTAPLFYALLFGPAGALTYRAINTLDSMFGHKNERYRYFGWASARIDDIANYLPSRITVPFIWLASCILRYNVKNSIYIFFRDKRNHHSPNSGLSEAAFAGALDVRLGGLNYYDGIADKKPFIGDPVRELEPSDIMKANLLMLSTTVLFTLFGIGIHYFIMKVLS
ncbi:MAG: cobalamin biosynthesis protein CobD [Fibrobacter sp.]|nr:cobalamin biosynthesis protein CobD [Fibrobacter sp.]